ncbi:MAG: 23S rRNA (uracil(1939)-C(5))-methyltransferase RlmD [Synechococcales cyanobacterium]
MFFVDHGSFVSIHPKNTMDIQNRTNALPRCPVADRCGGCQWQHIDYADQVTHKQQQAEYHLLGIPGWDGPKPWPMVVARDPYGYRNKAIFPVRADFRLGLYAQDSHDIVPINHCPVQDPRLDEILSMLLADLPHTGWIPYDERTHSGQIRYISLRVGRRTGECLITLISRDPDLPDIESWADHWHHGAGVVGVCLNINRDPGNRIWGSPTYTLAGEAVIHEMLGGLMFQLDSRSFFQAHTEQAESLFQWILQVLPLDQLHSGIDAYCGIGTLTLLLAQHLPRLVGIESIPEAIQQARDNAALNDLTHIEWHCAAVEAQLSQFLPADLVVVDPPRKGCDAAVLHSLLHTPPQWLVYISCALPSLGRDLSVLLSGFRVVQWRAADFFPQTPHIEIAVILQRRDD